MPSDVAKNKVLILTLLMLVLLGSGTVACFTGSLGPIGRWFHEQMTTTLPINDPEYMYNQALAFDQQGDSAYALAAARRAVIADPGYAPARKFLAAKDLKNHDFDDAAVQCKGLLSTRPDDTTALLGLASAYNGMGQSENSEQIYQQMADNPATEAVARTAARNSLEALRRKPGNASAPAPSAQNP